MNGHAAPSAPVDRIRLLAESFATHDVDIPVSGWGRFLPAGEEDRARRLGQALWLPESTAYGIFLYAYAALFGIPDLVQEALDRQPDRFSPRRLARTIRSTSSFILDAFGYDRRTGRQRDIFYSPSPAIRGNHQATRDRPAISNAAMIYFSVNLLKAAEWHRARIGRRLSDADAAAHDAYFAGFLRGAGRTYPPDRPTADTFAQTVDAELAGSAAADLWSSLPAAAADLGISCDPKDLQAFLPENTSRLFAAHIAAQRTPTQRRPTS